jgi:hypothetical protein
MMSDDLVRARELADTAYEVRLKCLWLLKDADETCAYAMNDLLNMLSDELLEA